VNGLSPSSKAGDGGRLTLRRSPTAASFHLGPSLALIGSMGVILILRTATATSERTSSAAAAASVSDELLGTDTAAAVCCSGLFGRSYPQGP
jgi:hypothetical protein